MLDLNQAQQYSATSDSLPNSANIDETKLLRDHQIIVKRIVNQLRHHATTHCSIEDMQQLGLMGLLEAGRRYQNIDDPNFPAFAVCRIRGAILDELRRLDWRSRKTRQQAHELNDVTRDLTKQLGRMPTENELIQALGTDSQGLHERLNASVASEMQSLDQLIEAGFERPFDEANSGIAHEQLRRSLESALQQLTKRDQLLLNLFYQQDLNLHEIALVLELTPARICQLHKQALKKLNHYLQS